MAPNGESQPQRERHTVWGIIQRRDDVHRILWRPKSKDKKRKIYTYTNTYIYIVIIRIGMTIDSTL